MVGGLDGPLSSYIAGGGAAWQRGGKSYDDTIIQTWVRIYDDTIIQTWVRIPLRHYYITM